MSCETSVQASTAIVVSASFLESMPVAVRASESMRCPSVLLKSIIHAFAAAESSITTMRAQLNSIGSGLRMRSKPLRTSSMPTDVTSTDMTSAARYS